MSTISDQMLNVKIVKEIEKYPILFNYDLPGYSKRVETDEAWRKVAREVDLTVAECKNKWKNFRTVCARQLRHSKMDPEFRKQRKKYYLIDIMEFALPFLKAYGNSRTKETTKKVNNVHDSTCNDHEDDERMFVTQSPTCSEIQMKLSPISTPGLTNINAESNIDDDHDADSMMSSPTSFQQNCSRKSKQIENDVMQENKTIRAYLKGRKQRLRTIHSQKDERDRRQGVKMFLLSLIPEILELNNTQLKLFKRRVFDLIDDIGLMETQLMDPIRTNQSFSETSFH